MLDVYHALDEALGNVLAAIDLEQTTVIIFALHAMGANLSQEHFVTPLMDRVNVKFSELEPGLYPSGRTPRRRSPMRILRENVPPWLQAQSPTWSHSESAMRSWIARIRPAAAGTILRAVSRSCCGLASNSRVEDHPLAITELGPMVLECFSESESRAGLAVGG